MKAELLLKTRVVYSASAFAELVLWRTPRRVSSSAHSYKYRLAYVVNEVCVVRYDNETRKGDHRHYGQMEIAYTFTTPQRLVADFQADIVRWNHENRHT